MLKEKWYLVKLKPNGFERAVVNFERQGIETFMPWALRRGRAGKRYVQKKQPLFLGYLFVAFDPDVVAWRTINSTYGVSHVVTFGSQEPAHLPEELISGLKARCDDQNFLLPPLDLRIGEKVKIIAGPFTDYIATIETLPSETRLGILFDCLGNKIPAEIGVGNVERIVD